MQLEAVGKPFRYKLRSGEEIFLAPGQPVELPDQSAHSLLKQAGERVRVVTPDPISICQAAENPSPIYWERTGSIVGPGTPEFLAKVGDGPKASYWVVVRLEGEPVWVNSIMLRSKREYDCQTPLKPFERIKEPR